MNLSYFLHLNCEASHENSKQNNIDLIYIHIQKILNKVLIVDIVCFSHFFCYIESVLSTINLWSYQEVSVLYLQSLIAFKNDVIHFNLSFCIASVIFAVFFGGDDFIHLIEVSLLFCIWTITTHIIVVIQGRPKSSLFQFPSSVVLGIVNYKKGTCNLLKLYSELQEIMHPIFLLVLNLLNASYHRHLLGCTT